MQLIMNENSTKYLQRKKYTEDILIDSIDSMQIFTIIIKIIIVQDYNKADGMKINIRISLYNALISIY